MEKTKFQEKLGSSARKNYFYAELWEEMAKAEFTSMLDQIMNKLRNLINSGGITETAKNLFSALCLLPTE